MRRFLPLACLLVTACAGAPGTPVERQEGLLGESAAEPGHRAARTLERLKRDPQALLDSCLARYQAATPGGPEWRLASMPGRIAMSSTADQALDQDERQANPDGWEDRGVLRSEIELADGDPIGKRCLVCRYDYEDSRSDPLTLFG
ncbi:hypothetical protein, partial [Geminicoccus harenae]